MCEARIRDTILMKQEKVSVSVRNEKGCINRQTTQPSNRLSIGRLCSPATAQQPADNRPATGRQRSNHAATGLSRRLEMSERGMIAEDLKMKRSKNEKIYVNEKSKRSKNGDDVVKYMSMFFE